MHWTVFSIQRNNNITLFFHFQKVYTFSVNQHMFHVNTQRTNGNYLINMLSIFTFPQTTSPTSCNSYIRVKVQATLSSSNSCQWHWHAKHGLFYSKISSSFLGRGWKVYSVSPFLSFHISLFWIHHIDAKWHPSCQCHLFSLPFPPTYNQWFTVLNFLPIHALHIILLRCFVVFVASLSLS